MLKRKRIKLFIETYEVIALKRGKAISLWCPLCARMTEMVSPEIAAVLLNISTRTIYRRIEAGAIHFSEHSDGSLLICLNSPRD
ncbi:MAG: hypothetical protein M3Q33_12015 [Acidobacteriota bacterium]|nr:hypothetical protein [Acidobacteriota bacterium]